MTEMLVSIADPELRAALGPLDGVRVIDWDLSGPAPEPHIDVVVPQYWGSAKRLANLAGVSTRLVQWQSIGFDPVARYLPPGHTVANAATVHETSTAELAVGLTIAAQRGIADFARRGATAEWFQGTRPSLADRRVTLIGYGGVGQAVDARLRGFETRITRVASRERDEQGPFGDWVHVYATEQLDEILGDTEIAIVTVPLTPATEHLLSAERLAALPDGALVVNVARGRVVDQDALTRETGAGRLRAALDVMTPEPLPTDHPLWRTDGVLITPHVGGDSTAMLPRMVALLKRQIHHLAAGEPCENIVIRGSDARDGGTAPVGPGADPAGSADTAAPAADPADSVDTAGPAAPASQSEQKPTAQPEGGLK